MVSNRITTHRLISRFFLIYLIYSTGSIAHESSELAEFDRRTLRETKPIRNFRENPNRFAETIQPDAAVYDTHRISQSL